jgi:hypothetical protein
LVHPNNILLTYADSADTSHVKPPKQQPKSPRIRHANIQMDRAFIADDEENDKFLALEEDDQPCRAETSITSGS